VRHALVFVCALALWPAYGFAGCSAKDAPQISQVLARGIDLNERFKRSVKSGDDSAYRALRKQNEQYSEETAFPCVQRASELLDRDLDEVLLRRVMEFAISRENSADETVSEVMATVFVKHPDAVAAGVATFPPSRARVLLRSIDSGWPSVKRTLEPTLRQEREAQLKVLRSAQSKRAATK
jgi:hypothetical protein